MSDPIWDLPNAELDVEHYVDEWMRSVGEGVAGYVTPKSAIGAVVYDDEGRILLVQRADSGVWLYPTGWADVGYSPSEVVRKEVHEETGIECEVEWERSGGRLDVIGHLLSALEVTG